VDGVDAATAGGGFAQAQANDTATTERQAAAGVRHRPEGF
jgi:hypothetical protein